MAFVPQVPTPTIPTIRQASLSDLGAITAVTVAAFLSDPQHSYRFPHASLYPADQYYYCSLSVAENIAIAATGAYSVMVAEMPSDEDGSVSQIVAVSVWRMPGTHVRREDVPITSASTIHPVPGDASPSNMHAWRAALAAGKRRIFDPYYGDDHFSLYNLATHPKYQRRGVGTKLCEWGMARAKEQGKAVTLFASPMGERVYRRLGFREIGVVAVQVEGEEEKVEIPALVWEG